MVIKDGALFFLSKPDGRVPGGGKHGYGLYYRDCRILNRYEWRVAGAWLQPLGVDEKAGNLAAVQLTNPELFRGSDHAIAKDTLGIRFEREIDGDHLTLRDRVRLVNYGGKTASFRVSIAFDAAFEDIFAVRGMLVEQLGTRYEPRWVSGALLFGYDGSDGRRRDLTIRFSREVEEDGTAAHFDLAIAPGQATSVEVALLVADTIAEGPLEPRPALAPAGRRDRRHRAATLPSAEPATVRCDDPFLERLCERSLRDIAMLRTAVDRLRFIAAGVPWFVTLFGRDSLITGYEMLAFDHRVAEDSLRALADLQGDRIDDWRDEQPGKILHEYRTGEAVRTGLVPGPAYYGTIDATILFLVLIARYSEWLGNLDLFLELRSHVDRALRWIEDYGDQDGDGYVEYRGRSSHGLENHGWKDSGDAIVNADGSLAEPPIALVEVQGYVYRAKRAIAAILHRLGESARAEQLDRQASELKARFNRDYWSAKLDCYVLALHGKAESDLERTASVVSSNPGHALWTGIAHPDKARRTAAVLLSPAMFSGWGLRTLATTELRYNPMGYHLGTVWPHDTAIAAAGLRRYGLYEESARLGCALIEAARSFRHHRLPELFAGFSRDDFDEPVRYPVADHPQAWAAAAIPYVMETMLGLVPEGYERRLRIVQPFLPPFVDWLELRGVRIGEGRVDLRFGRGAHRIDVDVLRRVGDVDVSVEADTSVEPLETRP